MHDVEHISWATVTSLSDEATPVIVGREEPLRQIDAYYGCAPESYRRPESSVSSLELAARALEPLLPIADLKSFIYVQSYPDIEPLAAPMQRLLERFGLHPEFPVGVTHVENGMSALDIAALLPTPAIFLNVEVLPYTHQRPEGWQDYAVAMRLSGPSENAQ